MYSVFVTIADQSLLRWAGNKISTQTGIGTSIAIAGVAMYSFIKARMEEEKRVSFYSYIYSSYHQGLLKPEYQWRLLTTDAIYLFS
jgi:hypothetical protein